MKSYADVVANYFYALGMAIAVKLLPFSPRFLPSCACAGLIVLATGGAEQLPLVVSGHLRRLLLRGCARNTLSHGLLGRKGITRIACLFVHVEVPCCVSQMPNQSE